MMRLSRWKIVATVAFALVLSLAFASQALGATTVIDNPDSAYLYSTTKIPVPLSGTGATSTGDTNLQVAFNEPYRLSGFAEGWTWGLAGQVEELHPARVWIDSSLAANWTLSRQVTTFGFEAAPYMPYNSTTATVSFVLSQGSEVVGTVTRTLRFQYDAERNVHAKLFAVSSDVAFDRVQITGTAEGSGQGLAITGIRYGFGTPASADIGGGFGDKVEDTYLYSYRPTTAYAASTANFAGKTASGEERILLRFPLDKLAGTYVRSATLSLTKSTSGGYIPLRAYRLRRPVTSSASWNNFQTGAAWGLPGAKDPFSDFYNDRFAASDNGTFQVGDLLKNAIASGSDTLDLLIVDPNPVAGRYNGFYSANCVYPAYRPKLTVEGIQNP